MYPKMANLNGYCSLIKATKSVLAKLDIENKIALREAVINAIVHNDYSFEVPPKFEIFPDRLEITSAGRLPESLTKEEFFGGVSIPRNKELMRIYRDVELVESLGSGIPRILRAYGEDCFKFTDNFIRIIFPISVQDGAHDSAQDRAHDNNSVSKTIRILVSCIEGEVDRDTLQSLIGIEHRTYFRNTFIKPALEEGYIEFTLPNEKRSKNQKYRLTEKGLKLKQELKNKNNK